jgi:hypothetical protein
VSQEDALDLANYLWRPVNFGFSGYDKIDKRLVREPRPFIYNHFEILRGLCTKTGLIRSLKAYYKVNEAAMQACYQVFDSTPTTFLVSSNPDDHEIT